MSANKQTKSNILTTVLNTKSIYAYALKWIGYSLLLSAFIGSASAGFLISLEWVTNYRENNLWIIVFLPIVGFLISWIYDKFGKNSGQFMMAEKRFRFEWHLLFI
jgi:H+/Cl- antiporter ClcA